MSFLETLRTGLDAVRTHRMRSSLTVLGILIGIAAVILTVGLGEGAQAQVTSEISALGTNLLTVTPGSSTSSAGIRGGLGSASTLTMADATALSSPVVAPDIKAVAPTTSSVRDAHRRHRELEHDGRRAARCRGCLGAGAEPGRGPLLRQPGSPPLGAVVTVLAPTTAEELFGVTDPVGQSVNIDGVPMTVVGVLTSAGTRLRRHHRPPRVRTTKPLCPSPPRRSVSSGARPVRRCSRSWCRPTSANTLSAAYQETNAELLALHHITTPADADFTITSQQSLLQTATSVDKTLTVLLAGIAGISLLVGGIGVMNIMLVSVTERIREIGLRKALGAAPAVIRRQFLVEASVLGLSGGVLGAALGLVGAAVLPHLISDHVAISPVATVGAIAVAIAIGVGFGVYPASRAARLAPIDALRNE